MYINNHQGIKWSEVLISRVRDRPNTRRDQRTNMGEMIAEPSLGTGWSSPGEGNSMSKDPGASRRLSEG